MSKEEFFDDLLQWKNKHLGKGALEQWQDLYGNQPESDCFSCEPVELFIQKASTVTGEVVDALLPGIFGVWVAALSLWFAWFLIKLFFLPDLIKEGPKSLPWIILSGSLLGGQALLSSTDGGLVQQLYNVAASTVGTVSNLILETSLASSPTDISYSYDGMIRLVYNAERSVSTIFDMCGRIMASSSPTNWAPFFMGALLVVPFGFVFLNYILQVGLAIFRLQFAAFFMPFVVMMMSFPIGRATVKKLLNTFLAAIVVLAAATFGFSLVIYGISSLKIGTGDMQAITWMDHRIFMPLVVSLLGGAIIFEGTSLANSLVGSFLDNTAAIMGAGSLAAAGGAALMVGNQARGGMGSLAGGLLSSQNDPQHQARVQQIIDRISPKPTPSTANPNPGKGLAW